MNRASINSKVASLLTSAKDIISVMKYEERFPSFYLKNLNVYLTNRLAEVYSKVKILAILGKNVSIWKDLSFLIVISL